MPQIRFIEQDDAPPVKILTCDCCAKTNLNDQFGRDWTCRCGQDFNAFGQALVPRDQWEEPYWAEEDL